MEVASISKLPSQVMNVTWKVGITRESKIPANGRSYIGCRPKRRSLRMNKDEMRGIEGRE